MKLLVDARTLGEKPSGIGMYLYYFTKGLAKNLETQIFLLTDVRESKEIQELAELSNVTVYSYGGKIQKGPALWRYFRFLKGIMAQVQPDVFWEVNNLLPIRMKNPYGRYVVTIHDIFPLTMPECYGKFYPLYFRYGLKKTLVSCDAVLFDSKTMEQEILSRYPKLKDKPHFVGGVIVPPSKERKTDAPRQGFFFYLGNLEKRKGTDLLLEAYRLYWQQGGRRELLLAGKVRDDDVKALLVKVGEETEGLSYLGYIDDERRNSLYQKCRAMIFPSRAEGFGIPVIEALNCDAPVIASRIPVFEEVAYDNVTWFELESGPGGLAEIMLKDEVKSSTNWTNPYSEERLVPQLEEFFR